MSFQRLAGLVSVLLISAGLLVPTAISAQGANVPATDYSLNRNDGPQLGKADRGFMTDLAQGNLGEIDAGRLALEKSQTPEIRQFAQQMLDDHAQALGEVEALAQRKAVLLPDGASSVAKAKLMALKALSGQLFDREYARHAGVGEHEKTTRLLRQIAADAQDPELRTLATRLLPVMETHLALARQLAAAK
jgi:putative membrane protein